MFTHADFLVAATSAFSYLGSTVARDSTLVWHMTSPIFPGPVDRNHKDTGHKGVERKGVHALREKLLAKLPTRCRQPAGHTSRIIA
jgi:hypothetical protein